jgi:hypothetical protein
MAFESVKLRRVLDFATDYWNRAAKVLDSNTNSLSLAIEILNRGMSCRDVRQGAESTRRTLQAEAELALTHLSVQSRSPEEGKINVYSH